MYCEIQSMADPPLGRRGPFKSLVYISINLCCYSPSTQRAVWYGMIYRGITSTVLWYIPGMYMRRKPSGNVANSSLYKARKAESTTFNRLWNYLRMSDDECQHRARVSFGEFGDVWLPKTRRFVALPVLPFLCV